MEMKARLLRFMTEAATTTETTPSELIYTPIIETTETGQNQTSNMIETSMMNMSGEGVSRALVGSEADDFISSFNFLVGIGLILFLLLVVGRFLYARRFRIKRAVSVFRSDESIIHSNSSLLSSALIPNIISPGYGTYRMDVEADIHPELPGQTSEYITCHSIEEVDNPRDLPAPMKTSTRL